MSVTVHVKGLLHVKCNASIDRSVCLSAIIDLGDLTAVEAATAYLYHVLYHTGLSGVALIMAFQRAAL